MRARGVRGGLILVLALLAAGTAAADKPPAVESLTAGGTVLMLRHARAPGIGDPPGFRLGDCTTQRNLDGVGREQARRIGRWLRRQGVTAAQVFSSQWCRCLETARLLELGPVRELSALNSFFARAEEQAPRLAALRGFLADLPSGGPLVVLVTHQVTITALTGETVGSGVGVLLRLTANGAFEVLGRMDFAP
jgi:broad specificity phosphatase PhoE